MRQTAHASARLFSGRDGTGLRPARPSGLRAWPGQPVPKGGPVPGADGRGSLWPRVPARRRGSPQTCPMRALPAQGRQASFRVSEYCLPCTRSRYPSPRADPAATSIILPNATLCLTGLGKGRMFLLPACFSQDVASTGGRSACASRRQCQWLRRHAVPCAGTACAWQGKPVKSGQSAGCDAGGGLPERAGRARSLPSWEARRKRERQFASWRFCHAAVQARAGASCRGGVPLVALHRGRFAPAPALDELCRSLLC